jgi:hypothetical protein
MVLAHCLRDRFERLGDIGDISEAISLFKRALADLPRTDPDWLECLHNLGTAFATRFRHVGDLADINQSLLILEEAAIFFLWVIQPS